MSKQSCLAAAISFFVLLALVFSFPVKTSASPPDRPASQPAACASGNVTASLSGIQEFPPNASPATGTVVMSINAPAGLFSGSLTVSGLTSPAIAAHIHNAPVGFNGPVVETFVAIPATTSFIFPITVGFYVPVPNIPLAAAILANPAGYYVNVHTQTFPGGEIRGQLVCVQAPAPSPTSRPAEVPEADTLILVTSGLGGLATWVGWKWRMLKRTRP